MSGWAGVCTLIATVSEHDELGVSHKKERCRRVPCNVYGISQTAYYTAAQAGVKPQAVITVRACAYSGEKLCEFGGIRYAIDSAVVANVDNVRLTLVEKVGNR